MSNSIKDNLKFFPFYFSPICSIKIICTFNNPGGKKLRRKLTVRFLMNRKTFWVCCGPLMISGKQAASWEVIRSWGSLLWKAAPSTPSKEYKTRDHDHTSNSFFAWRTSVKLCLIHRLISPPLLKIWNTPRI